MVTDEQQLDTRDPAAAREAEWDAASLKKLGFQTLIVVSIGAIFAYAIGGLPCFIGVMGTCGAVILGALGTFVMRQILAFLDT